MSWRVNSAVFAVADSLKTAAMRKLVHYLFVIHLMIH